MRECIIRMAERGECSGPEGYVEVEGGLGLPLLKPSLPQILDRKWCQVHDKQSTCLFMGDSSPFLSVVSLSVVLVTHGQL